MTKRPSECLLPDGKRTAEESAASPLHHPLLRQEYAQRTSRLSTLALDVVRYVLQPMVFSSAGIIQTATPAHYVHEETWQASPLDVEVTRDDNLVLVSLWHPDVVVMRRDGTELSRFRGPAYGLPAEPDWRKPPTLKYCKQGEPYRMVVTAHNQLAIIDEGTDFACVTLYTLDGQLLTTFGHQCGGHISDLAVDHRGNFFVCNAYNNLIAVYNKDHGFVRFINAEHNPRHISIYGDRMVTMDNLTKVAHVYTLDAADFPPDRVFMPPLTTIHMRRVPLTAMRGVAMKMRCDAEGKIALLDHYVAPPDPSRPQVTTTLSVFHPSGELYMRLPADHGPLHMKDGHPIRRDRGLAINRQGHLLYVAYGKMTNCVHELY